MRHMRFRVLHLPQQQSVQAWTLCTHRPVRAEQSIQGARCPSVKHSTLLTQCRKGLAAP